MKGVIVLVNIIIVLAAVFFIIRTFFQGKFFRKLKVKWPLFVYLLLLLAFVPVNYLIPQKSLLKAAPSKDICESMTRIQELKSLAMENKLESVPWLRLNDERLFEYDKNQLEIQSTINILPVFVRRNDYESKILSKYFTTKTYISNIEFTKKITLAVIQLDDGCININYPVPNYIEFSGFKNDFNISQFIENKNNDSFAIFKGNGVLYLEVPKTMKIINRTGADIKYLN